MMLSYSTNVSDCLLGGMDSRNNLCLVTDNYAY